MSQEMGKGDREGIISEFEKLGTETGKGMAQAFRECGELKDQQE
jgi:transcriptional regulator